MVIPTLAVQSLIKLAREKGRKTEEKADEYVRNIHKINVKKTIFNLVFDFEIMF